MNDELEKLIEAGESETVEFKSKFNSDVIETAVAFANTRGGRVLLGVSDAGQCVASHFGAEALRDYVNRIANASEPSIYPEAERMVAGNGDVIVLSIPEFPLKPVSTRGRCFCRSGSTTRQMTPTEIAEMHLRSTGQSMDAVVVADKCRDDLDFDAVRDYMRKATAQGRRSFSEQDDPWQALRKLELVRSEQEITRAALLLFGKNPQSPLTQAVVHAGRLREKVHIMDNRVIDGSIIDQVDETVDFIKKNLHVRFEISGEPERTEIWDYPLAALREAVVNAVCHRDYGDTADIQIKIFGDALQVWSPGFLPFNMTIDELLDPEHCSKPRNKLIAQVFYDLGLIERYGSGIHRILDACRDAGLSEPLLENFSGGFRVKFQQKEQLPFSIDQEASLRGNGSGGVLGEGLGEGLNEGLKLLLSTIRENPGIQAKELETILVRPIKTIERQVKTLTDFGRIERRGSRKTGGYFLVELNTALGAMSPPPKRNTLGIGSEGLNEGISEGLGEGLNEGLKLLLSTIRENPGIQAKELGAMLERPIKTIERQVKTLTDKDLIERRGSRKTGGYWERFS